MKNHYIYDGAVMEFDRIINERWTGETWAVSEAKARSNLLYQYKKKHGLTSNKNIKLSGKVKVL